MLRLIPISLLFGFLSAQSVYSGSYDGPQRTVGEEIEQLFQRSRSVTYPGLGTFSLAAPYNNTDWLPSTPRFIHTNFNLFTRTNPTTGQRIRINRLGVTNLRNSHLAVNQPVKILVHGFLQHRQSAFIINMTEALLEYAPMNVIVAGWSGGAGFPYSQAVANTRVVGAQISRLVLALQALGVDLMDVHIIGHSLGAQVAGYAGARISARPGPKLGRITGLDPAQPSFEGFDKAVHLDKTDANFVDIIHTDAIPYDTVGGYGIIHPVGHIDFYPNGGHHQPGCHEDPSIFSFVQDIWARGIHSAEYSLSCSHERSTKFFLASITPLDAPCSFTAFPCRNEADFMSGRCSHCGNRPCPLMGFHADKNFGARGSFYLNTTDAPPFCGHHLFVSVHLDQGMDDVEGSIKVQLTGRNGRTVNEEIARSTSLQGGEEYTGLIVGDAQLGQVTAVDVYFNQTSSVGSFIWGQTPLKLSNVSVRHAERMPRKYFCQTEMTVESGHHLTLTNGSFNPSHCQ